MYLLEIIQNYHFTSMQCEIALQSFRIDQWFQANMADEALEKTNSRMSTVDSCPHYSSLPTYDGWHRCVLATDKGLQAYLYIFCMYGGISKLLKSTRFFSITYMATYVGSWLYNSMAVHLQSLFVWILQCIAWKSIALQFWHWHFQLVTMHHQVGQNLRSEGLRLLNPISVGVNPWKE